VVGGAYQDFESTGARLNGNHSYTVTYAKGKVPPGKGFWSLPLITVRNSLAKSSPSSLAAARSFRKSAEQGLVLRHAIHHLASRGRFHSSEGPFLREAPKTGLRGARTPWHGIRFRHGRGVNTASCSSSSSLSKRKCVALFAQRSNVSQISRSLVRCNRSWARQSGSAPDRPHREPQ
jgi:hypothetical protein